MGGILLLVLIVFLVVNNLDPTRVYDKKTINMGQEDEQNNSSFDLLGLGDDVPYAGLLSLAIIVSVLIMLFNVLIPVIFQRRVGRE